MPWWECTSCNYTLQGEKAPNECPQCGKKCAFNNVTCYTPECGECGNGKEHIDQNLIHKPPTAKSTKGKKKK